MNIPSSNRPNGFTLVELLVVIAIIAVLAGAGFAAGNAAIQKAKKTAALATCTALESAVNNFFTEYGSMPKDGTETPVSTSDDTTLLQTLLGLDTTVNTRGIKFLSAKEGKANRNGLIYNTDGSSVTGLYDPWGGGYKVMMDLNYDERIDIPDTVKDGGKTLNGRHVAAWSLGADGKSGSGGSKGDDVITW